MRLYIAPNTIAVAIAIALEEAGIAYEPVLLNFAEGEQRSATYHAVNPKGRVPSLETDGKILTETGAILEFIAAQAPALLPTDPMEAARARSAMYYLASTMHVNHAHKMRGHRWADAEASHQDMTAKVPETMAASAQYVENHALAGPFVVGDAMSLADPYLFMVCAWLPGDDVDLAPFPKIRAHQAAMEARASVKAVREKGLFTL